MRQNKNIFFISGAIIIAGLLIAGAVIFSSNFSPSSQKAQINPETQETVEEDLVPSVDNVEPVIEEDHLRGDPNAPVTLIEFSDFECSFCSRFHATISEVLEEFSGEVKWVYRHFPLSFHAQALPAALTSECIAELGGNDAFWYFADEVFGNQDKIGPDFYQQIAQDLGLDLEVYEECISSEKHFERVKNNFEQAIMSGGQGTPYSIVVAKDGELIPFSGALSLDQVRDIIKQAIND